MFGRRFALTTVKAKKSDEDTTTDTMTIEEIANLTRETIVTTVAGVSVVIVAATGALTIMRIAEHYVKYYYR